MSIRMRDSCLQGLEVFEPSRKRPRLIVIAFLIVITWILIFLAVDHALAQEEGDGWTTPINLSKSGGTNNPRIIANSDQILFVIWDDLYGGTRLSDAGSAVSFLNADQWVKPLRSTLPLVGQPSKLIPSQGNLIHAFWIDEGGTLLYKAVVNNLIGNAVNWLGALKIATSVIQFDAAIDTQNRIHIAYLHVDERGEQPAGIYYLKPTSTSWEWSSPIALYQSDYLRRFLTEDQEPDEGTLDGLANVDIEVASTHLGTHVYVGWDDPSLRRIFLSQSMNSGSSWEEPIQVDGPDSENPYSSPRNIKVNTDGSRIILFWNVVQAGGSCNQIYQTSQDGGKTWSHEAPMIGELSGCPDTIYSFGTSDGIRLFLSIYTNQTYLTAWDGERWSLPQWQSGLTSFIDQETYDLVEFGNFHASYVGDSLIVVGCDVGGGDVWLTQRAIISPADLFGPRKGWYIRDVKAIGSMDVLSLVAVSDSRGVIHTLWSQFSEDGGESEDFEINYANWDREQISGPFTISDEEIGLVNQLELAILPDNRLLTLWSDGASGELASGWSAIEQAVNKASWFFLSSGVIGQSPRIIYDSNGAVYAVFSIPINEHRGVYISRLSEEELNWQEPVQIYDAANSGCEVVEHPSLAITNENDLHAVWSCSTFPGGSGPIALYYANSFDGGRTWSEEELVLDRGVSWSQVMGVDERVVHLVWEEKRLGRTSTWHMVSLDNGKSWEAPENLSLIDNETIATDLVADRSGQLHLMQVVRWGSDSSELSYTFWDGQAWSAREELRFIGEIDIDIHALSSSLAGDDLLVAVFAGLGSEEIDGARQYKLGFAGIPIEVPGVEQQAISDEQQPMSYVLDADNPTPTPTFVTISTSTPTPNHIARDFDDSQKATEDRSIVLIVGVTTTVVLIIVFGLIWSRSTKKN
jgi:hypothetical protein